MNNEGYINIQGWMINNLGIKGNELILYAIIFGFSQDGQTEYYGSLRYISVAMKISTRTASRLINTLIEKGLIQRTEESKYRHNVIRVDKVSVDKVSDKGRQSVYLGVDRSTTNNNNTINKKYKYNQEQKRLTYLLIEKIETNFPNLIKEPNIDEWSNQIRLMNETDGVDIKTIEFIINWVHGGNVQDKNIPENSFWSKNIRSAGKLREKRETLLAQIMQKYKIDKGVLQDSNNNKTQVL